MGKGGNLRRGEGCGELDAGSALKERGAGSILHGARLKAEGFPVSTGE